MAYDVRDTILSSLSEQGWGALSDLGNSFDESQKRLLSEMREEADVVAKVFDNDAGRDFLVWLVRKTLMRPPSELEANASTIEDYALRQARRNGQNAIVFMILSALNVANFKSSIPGADMEIRQ